MSDMTSDAPVAAVSQSVPPPTTKKAPPSNLVVPPKKPKLTKAERRALQEQQRAAKSGGPGAATDANSAAPQTTQQQKQHSSAAVAAASTASTASIVEPKQHQNLRPLYSTAGDPDGTTTPDLVLESTHSKDAAVALKKSKEVSLLSHLPPYRDPHEHSDLFFSIQLGGSNNCNSYSYSYKPSSSSTSNYTKLDSAILQTGRGYATGAILGPNARCRAMLRALSTAIANYHPPRDYNGDIRNLINNQILKPSFTYWTNECRPHSVSMGNAFTFVKSAVVAALDRDMEWTECQRIMIESIELYIQERIEYADLAIAAIACDKVLSNGDVLLTYGNSDAIRVVLLEAAHRKISFLVIVVDSKPLLEGRIMLRSLREAGLDCTYILLNALSYVMKDVTKILLGANALLSDGSVYARVGTACVALSAQKDIPVLVCAETYKISSRVQLEAITNNELGNPQHVVEGELGDNLRVINLLYDLTPASFISGIVTEMGILPPTSVAVLLREMNPQDAYNGF